MSWETLWSSDSSWKCFLMPKIWSDTGHWCECNLSSSNKHTHLSKRRRDKPSFVTGSSSYYGMSEWGSCPKEQHLINYWKLKHTSRVTIYLMHCKRLRGQIFMLMSLTTDQVTKKISSRSPYPQLERRILMQWHSMTSNRLRFRRCRLSEKCWLASNSRWG
jgi:hypothetical protein